MLSFYSPLSICFKIISSESANLYRIESRLTTPSLYEAHVRITPSQYDQYRAKWRKHQKKHQKKLDRLSETNEQYYVTVSYLLDIVARGKELFEGANPNEKRELIGLLGQNLLLDGKQVQITLYKPFDTLASCVDDSTWLLVVEDVRTKCSH